MKNKIIYIVLIIFIIVSMFTVHNQRMNSQEIKYNKIFARQSFDIMMFLSREMRKITAKYENGILTDEDLNNHYQVLDDYVLSVYNQKPTEFIFQVRQFRLMKKNNVESFDNETYINYLKIVELFDSIYAEIASDKSDDERLLMYEIYSSDELKKQLKEILLNLK